MTSKQGCLYIVATPIGNLSDITLRAIETLKTVDLIACEDTRQSLKLLNRLSIKKPLISYHQHSKIGKISFIIEELKAGKRIALITDSGTPAISDPAGLLIAEARTVGFTNIIPIPGPSALAAAVSVSGMIEKDFYFAGFLPKKKGRQKEIKFLLSLGKPIVIYESAQRIFKTLADFKALSGSQIRIFISREMTKVYEEFIFGSIDEAIEILSARNLKGEIVLILSFD
jgi:16S rRNA (cytidine1402-2'-O)-methyltransferase